MAPQSLDSAGRSSAVDPREPIDPAMPGCVDGAERIRSGRLCRFTVRRRGGRPVRRRDETTVEDLPASHRMVRFSSGGSADRSSPCRDTSTAQCHRYTSSSRLARRSRPSCGPMVAVPATDRRGNVAATNHHLGSLADRGLAADRRRDTEYTSASQCPRYDSSSRLARRSESCCGPTPRCRRHVGSAMSPLRFIVSARSPTHALLRNDIAVPTTRRPRNITATLHRLGSPGDRGLAADPSSRCRRHAASAMSPLRFIVSARSPIEDLLRTDRCGAGDRSASPRHRRSVTASACKAPRSRRRRAAS